MKAEQKELKKQKRVRHSIRSKIIATAVCPLIAMSTAVSVLAINDYDAMFVANVIAVILFVGIVQLIFVSNGIVKSVRMAEEYLNQLSEGNLNIAIDERLNKRDDEIGCMSQSLTVLKRKLKDSMRDIQTVSVKLVDSENGLEKSVSEVDFVTKQIQKASDQIACNSEKQNEDMADASANIEEINNLISHIALSVEQLKETSGKMQEDGKNSIEIMCNLMESNKHTNHVIERINSQIHMTHEAAEKITAVTEMITAIAKQTGILALNASIEAARAGEAGRGFSVVAEEISTLANQSSDSAKEINDLINTLSAESRKMLEIMDEVMTEAKNQKENLEKTQIHFQKVDEGIETSLHKIIEIGKQAEICDAEKDKVTKHIEVLKILTEESVASTKNTQQMVSGLIKCISDTEEIAILLKEYANTLDEQIGYFVTEI